MDLQSKFLNKEYLETRLRDFGAIKKNELSFMIHGSNRPNSKTLYVVFWSHDCDKNYQRKTVRISDHSLKDCVHPQFIVEPLKCLTKKKKQQFVRIIERAINCSKHKNIYEKFKKISNIKKN